MSDPRPIRAVGAFALVAGLAVMAACTADTARTGDGADRTDRGEPGASAPRGQVAAVPAEGREVGGGSTATDSVPLPPDGWKVWAAGLPETGVRDRFLAATERMIGTPYQNGPLGEGEAGGPDPDPRVDFARADCVTYLEQALAMAVLPPAAAGSDAELIGALDAIRYRGGEVDFATRNHYMVADWIPANAWLATDVTADVAQERLVVERRTIDRAAFLRDQGVEPRIGRDDAREIDLGVVPVEALSEVEGRIESGDLVFWVGAVDGIFVLHTGLAVRDGSGELAFRHASSRSRGAVQEPFADYAASTSFRGFVVLRLNDRPEIPGDSG